MFQPLLDIQAALPRWILVACAVVVVAAGFWILGKMLRLVLWLLLIALLVGAAILAYQMFSGHPVATSQLSLARHWAAS